MGLAEADGGLALVAIRGLFVACCLSAFGAQVFRLTNGLRGAGRRLPARAALGGVFLGSLWLACEAVNLSEAVTPAAALAALPALLATRFGEILLGQMAALALVPAAGPLPATLLAGLATGLQALHGHGAAMGEGRLVLSSVLHLLAAGLWLGQLLPLLLTVRRAERHAAWQALARFSPLGLAAVIVLAGTAAFQGWQMAGGIGGLAGTAFGRTALVKAALFLVLLALAGLNRFVFMRHFRTSPEGRQALILCIAVEAGIGGLVVLTAALLSSLPPGMHEQPLWPFSRRPSLTAFAEPELRAEILMAAGMLAAAAMMVLVTLRRPVLRWISLLAAAAIAVAAVRHFDLLLVEAYPTSYFLSPNDQPVDAAARGRTLFQIHCAACHGPEGRGDGPEAAALPVPPADLTAGHLWDHTDGELFWRLSHGIDEPDGSRVMPGFADRLDDQARWDLIDFIRANNAALAHREAMPSDHAHHHHHGP